MPDNVLIIDSDYEEANGFVKGLKDSTKEDWIVALYENNKIYGLRRYVKFFIVAAKTVLYANKYKHKTVLCWQQFYGIAIAFFNRLFHVKKKYTLVIMTFIYKPKNGIVGKIFYKFVRYAITSKYVDKIILTTQSEAKLYKDIFHVDEKLFSFAECGAVEYDPTCFDDSMLKNKNYLFSTGRSNRDYNFLINALKDTEYHLVIACDTISMENINNIEIHHDIFGENMLRYMRNARAVVIALDDDKIASGQLVLLHAMNMGVPVIITRSHGVTDDYVTNGYNGLVIEKTKDSLLDALHKVFYDDNLYNNLCENGKKEFATKYTYYEVGKKVGKILKSI